MPRSLYISLVPLLATLLMVAPGTGTLASLPAASDASQPVVTAAARPSEKLVAQRERYLEAREALQQRKMDRFESLADSLRDYPLHAYLKLLYMQKRLFAARPAAIHAMMAAYGNIPKAQRLYETWLLHLGRSGQWSTLASEHDGASGSDRLRCLSLRAHLKTGNSQAVMKQMPELWQNGYSLPEACNPLLDYWREQDGLTADLAWTRFQLALEAGNYHLAGYLRRFLDSDDRRHSKLLVDLHHNPGQLRRARDLDPEHPRSSAVVAHAMTRLTEENVTSAADIWPTYRSRFDFDRSTLARIERKLALILATRFHEDARQWLDSALETSNDRTLHEWRVRVALRQQDWDQVLADLHRMPPDLRSESRWRYWMARAVDHKGLSHTAEALFERVADDRSFYGFMAADQLGSPYRLNHRDFAVRKKQLRSLAHNPALQRARELYHLGRLGEARREWRSMRSGLNHDKILLASRLAQHWGWHEQGVMGAIATNAWDHLTMRFPLAYREHFHSVARDRQLDVNWIYAVARQESAFRPDARSQRGALGLLQLLPATARSAARNAGVTYQSLRTLLDPASNIRIGAAHLESLLEDFDNNRILATAAYNAGAHRVRQWLGEHAAQLDSDVWVETMPYHETRQYVRRVMAYTVIYGYRRGEPPKHLLTKRELACMCLDE